MEKVHNSSSQISSQIRLLPPEATAVILSTTRRLGDWKYLVIGLTTIYIYIVCIIVFITVNQLNILSLFYIFLQPVLMIAIKIGGGILP